MYESLNYAKRKYSNEATDEWNSVVEGVAEAELTHPEMAWFSPTDYGLSKPIQT